MDTENKSTTPKILTRVSVVDTIKAIEPGTSATYECDKLTSYAAACGQVSRLNAAAGRKEFSISSSDMGKTYTISRT